MLCPLQQSHGFRRKSIWKSSGRPPRAVSTSTAAILEVLSPSTEAYHRGFKAVQYRKLPSLQEYALVSQAEARIEIFRRQASGDWMLSEYAGTHAICRFASVNCEMALSGLYDRIVFEGEDPLSAHPSY